MSKHVTTTEYTYDTEFACNINECPESALGECKECYYRQEILGTLKHYEDLEEQGRLIKIKTLEDVIDEDKYTIKLQSRGWDRTYACMLYYKRKYEQCMCELQKMHDQSKLTTKLP